MYKNHVESLREAGDHKKNLQENLGIITAESESFEEVQHYHDFNNDIQPRSNKYLTQKLNVVNDVFSTKRSQ